MVSCPGHRCQPEAPAPTRALQPLRTRRFAAAAPPRIVCSVDAAAPLSPDLAARPTVALALSAGGARGLAHIGVIEELERRGYRIVALAGTSMGALIGGVYALGRLGVYRDWVLELRRMDVLRLVDWTFSSDGFIKGEKIIATLRGLVGDARIEDLPLAYTAVATDIDRGREVWLARGGLFDAIRASIAIPTVFRPHRIDGLRLVDGGVLNPVPVTPLMRERADRIIAVSVDGPAEPQAVDTQIDEVPAVRGGRRFGWSALFGGRGAATRARAPGALELLLQSMDLMQAKLARLRLASNEPDLLIQLPRTMAAAYEFYRAEELIEHGRQAAAQALDAWPLAPAAADGGAEGAPLRR